MRRSKLRPALTAICLHCDTPVARGRKGAIRRALRAHTAAEPPGQTVSGRIVTIARTDWYSRGGPAARAFAPPNIYPCKIFGLLDAHGAEVDALINDALGVAL